MTRIATSACALLVFSAALQITVASAQSSTIIVEDLFDETPPPPAALDAGAPDAGASVVDGTEMPKIQIVGVSVALPRSAEVSPDPENPRVTFAEVVTGRARRCIAQTVDSWKVDVRFSYLIREGRPHATLTAVSNDENLHVSKAHVTLLHRINSSEAIDIDAARQIFLECIEVVPLPTRPVVSERLSFQILSGAKRLRVKNLTWTAI